MPGFEIKLNFNEHDGRVKYDETTLKVEVDLLADVGARERVERHLTTSREFMIPTGPNIDEFVRREAKPTESAKLMRQALCTLYADTGVWVDWTSLLETA